jgi:hypothetical protein
MHADLSHLFCTQLYKGSNATEVYHAHVDSWKFEVTETANICHVDYKNETSTVEDEYTFKRTLYGLDEFRKWCKTEYPITIFKVA